MERVLHEFGRLSGASTFFSFLGSLLVTLGFGQTIPEAGAAFAACGGVLFALHAVVLIAQQAPCRVETSSLLLLTRGRLMLCPAPLGPVMSVAVCVIGLFLPFVVTSTLRRKLPSRLVA